MDQINLTSILLGTAVSILGYFLKSTMEDLKSVINRVNENSAKLGVIENDLLNKTSHLNEKFDDLNSSVKELTAEIKALSKEIQKKI